MIADNSQVDLNTLQWVKSEIDETLKQARTALELHVEAPDSGTQLQQVANYLHQVRGTLQMVELYGAAMLSEELENLTQSLATNEIEGRDDIYEVMMRAMWQLPDYLERLQSGHKDIPMVLLPLLNDLRAARKAPLLTESALFTPDLDVTVPDTDEHNSDEDLPSLARKLRHTYHLGLLDWYRDRDSKGGLRKLDKVIEKLRYAANDQEVNRVLWSASGVIEALREGGIEASVAVKLLMGQLDRQIKKIIDQGESVLTREPPQELEKNLLYYVASSSTEGERVHKLKEAFKLADALPDEATLERARADLTGPNAELLQTVSAVLLENLVQVKDNLDVFVRSDERDPKSLTPLCESLNQTADTLGMLGFGKQRQTVMEQVDQLRAFAEGREPVDENQLMDVAHELLSIESMLHGPTAAISSSESSTSIAVNEEKLKNAEQQALLKTVMNEARDNMGKVKEAMSQFLEAPRNLSLISDVPDWLDQIRGSFEILHLERPAQLVDTCRAYVQQEMINATRAPDPASTDALADALSSIEYYMDSVAGQWGNPNAILEVAEQRLAQIGFGDHIQELSSGVIDAQQQDDETQNDLAINDVMLESSDLSEDDDTMIDIGAPGTETGEIELDAADMSTAEISLEDFENELEAKGISLDDINGTTSDTQEIEFDASQLDIGDGQGFEDELTAELEKELSLSEPEENPTQEIELDTSDLDFHEEIELVAEPSELSRNTMEIDFGEMELESSNEIAVTEEPEFDFNNVTQEIEFDESVIDLVEKDKLTEPEVVRPAPSLSVQDIPVLNDRLEAWSEDVSDKDLTRAFRKEVTNIKKQAKLSGQEEVAKVANDMASLIKTVNKGETEFNEEIKSSLKFGIDTLMEVLPEEPVLPASNVIPLNTAAKLTPTPAPVIKKKDVPEEIDNEIIEIFLEEAEEEFGNISVRLPAWQSDPSDEAILKELRRSFHTLKGSGRLVGASEVGEFAWAFENMLNRVIDHTIEADQTIFNLLEQARLTLPSLFDMFKTGEGASQEIFNLMEQADAISQGAPINASIEIAAPPVDKGDTPFKESAPTIPDIDEVLRDIYRKEAANHLNALREYVDDWRADTDKSANQKLIRALHTLTGSSRTAGLPGLASICSRLEKVADVFAAESNDVTDELLELVEQSMSFVQQTVDMLDNPGIPIPEHDDLLQGIQDMEVSLGGSLVNIEPTDSGLQRLQVETSNEPSSQFDLSQSSSQSLQADDSYDDELLEIFLEEGSEILEDSDQVLHRWGDDLANADHLEALQRQLHTLKGGARMAGVTAIGDLSHSIESMLTAIAEGQLEPSEEIHDVMLRTQDRLVHLLDQLKNRQKLTPAKDLIAVVAGIIGHEVSFDDEEEEEAIHAQHIPDDSFMDVEDIQLEPVAESSEPIVAEENVPTLTSDNVVPLTSLKPIKSQQLTSPQQTMPEKKEKRELVRVRSDLLDNLVNFAGEVSIYRSRMEQQTNAFRYNLTELDETVSRLRDQLRKFEMEAEAQIQYRAEESLSATQEDFDPLEFDRFTQMQQLSRGMLESLNDLDSLRGILGNLTRESETLLVQQSRVNTELQEGLMRTRMVPFSSQTSRLRRIVRQTAEELGKFAELHLHGADSEMDRTVLERMLPALEHMLRNAVAHGLEDSETRRNTGKEETGQIDLSISREGADIVIKLTDDGQGIDLDAIQSKAIAKGMIKPGANVTKETLLEMIMESGFSTADEVTQISGRGVGMDVVNSEIKQLGGILNINTEQGVGTMFTVSLPLTLSVTRALMVNVSEDTYAIPLLSVEGVERVDTTQLEEIYAAENPVYHWVGQDYPFIHLGETMGISKRYIPRDRGKIPLLIVRSGEFRAAIQVDNLIGSREVVVKPVGAQLSTMQGISGATIMGDGSVVLIIDLGVLVRRVAQTAELYPAEPVEAVIEQPVAEKPLVMVVDDSITVRKVTTRLLERNDYRSTSAKDGVDALSQLQEVHPDVILLDVEMPRMDGFELATNIRNDDQLKHIPIIMITSRTGQKHRDRAMSIGVNFYLGKPYNEAELLEHIQGLLQPT